LSIITRVGTPPPLKREELVADYGRPMTDSFLFAAALNPHITFL